MKNNVLLAAVAALLIGFIAGNALALGSDNEATNEAAKESTSAHMDDDSHEGHSDGDEHSHGDMFMVGEDEAPTVSVSVTEDAKSGWNVSIDTTDFTFTPENVNGENVVGEGHAHLYVDDEKIGRLYGPDFHYSGNFDGTKTFRVTLNANDHGEYAIGDQVIEAVIDVTHESHSN